MFRYKWPRIYIYACILVTVYELLKTIYNSYPIMQLPFTPPLILVSITHYGLEGNDLSECSMPFIFLIYTLTILPIVKKWFKNAIA